MRDYQVDSPRGNVLFQERAPGEVWISWKAANDADPIWPGMMDAKAMAGFPHDEALAEQFSAVDAWVNAQPWAQPLPAVGQSIAGDVRNGDNCPVCGTYTPAFAARGSGAAGIGQPLPPANQQEQSCTGCGARLVRTVGEPWRATAPRDYAP